MLDRTQVVLYDCAITRYPQAPPFHPGESYPEYPFPSDLITAEGNPVYAAVREMLHMMGLDHEHFGSPEWDPLGQFVRPGETVVVKPNFVVSEHPLGQRGMEAAVAHGSVLRPLIDYAYIATQGRGRILVADSPIKEVDFQRTLDLTGIEGVKVFYDSHTTCGLGVMDFRDMYVVRNPHGFMVTAKRLPGDPSGYTLVDLGPKSMYADIAEHWRRYRSTAVYYENVMEEFHSGGRHLYSIPNTLLRADAVISVAKLKTHRKAGVTLSLKNAVGITNEKRSLPHHREGAPAHGGDAVADDARLDARLEDRFRDFVVGHASGRLGLRLLGPSLRTLQRRVLRPLLDRVLGRSAEALAVEGDWYGNDTVWRMALDLNHILLFADEQGQLQTTPQRGYLSVIDGVLGGEGEGPLYPTPKECGVLLAGFHPVTVDLVATALMGFDYRKVPIVRNAWERAWPLRPPVSPEEVPLLTNRPLWNDLLRHGRGALAFEPSAGWKDHIERAIAAHGEPVEP